MAGQPRGIEDKGQLGKDVNERREQGIQQADRGEANSETIAITIRTARARISGENLVGLGMASILSRIGASGKAGAVHLARRHTISSTPAGAFGFVKRISSAVIDVTIRL